MIYFRFINQVINKLNNDQGRLLTSNFFPRISLQIQCCHAVNSSSVSKSEPEEIGGTPQKKRVRVAILGRPNAGKSTLINQILKLNVCDVSSKSHTTQFPLKTVLIRDDTQIVFVDTPGLVTNAESIKFELSKSFWNWKKSIFHEVDIIGVMVDANLVVNILKYSKYSFKYLGKFLESKPAFVIWNKVDLVKNKKQLARLVNESAPSDTSQDPLVNESAPSDTSQDPPERKNVMFSKSFLISALKNEGVSEIVDYLLEQAKPHDWATESHQIFDLPLHKLIINLVRAKMLEILPQEVPYVCSYEVEYLEENDWGEIICVALVICKYRKHKMMIVERKKQYLRQLTGELESDLYKILKKVVRLRLVVVSKEKKDEKQRH